jgi:glycosyltransferase involved in cell wall biosynthesis
MTMSATQPKLSIITAVYNQLAMNQIYWENLVKNTQHPFELIVIDNASTDASADFFESVGARVIRNPGNYSYPVSQNQGIALAKGEWLAFLNNDIIVSEGWDKTLIANAEHNQLDVITSCGIERVESKDATKKLRRRWNRIRGLVGLFGTGRKSLLLMHKWMYGNWSAFCQTRQERFKYQAVEGFVGNTVMFSRRALDILGPWDETQQAADFDLFLRTAMRAREVGDIRPMHIALDCFNHHYIRLTMKGGYPPFVDRDKLIPLDQKWTAEQRALLVEN